MFEKELLIDGKAFAKGQKISAKRPTEYWLAFIKRYVLSYKKPWFHKRYLLFTIPVVILIIMLLSDADADDIMPIIFVSSIFCFFIVIFLTAKARQAIVPINAFHELAKFIISIKGDIYKNRFDMRLNSGVIEEDVNLLDPNKIGLAKRHRTVFKPFELERFKANIILKDGSICSLALNQITLRVTTTKRRSSGKTKTKMKRKHKFFHLLTLKLKDVDYQIFNQDNSIMANDRFEIILYTENGFHYVKVKAKVKVSDVPSKLKENTTHKPSLYTEMIQYLLDNKIMTKVATNKLIQ
nr:hypothetical protein [uncultured Psychroserpens sp.]